MRVPEIRFPVRSLERVRVRAAANALHRALRLCASALSRPKPKAALSASRVATATAVPVRARCFSDTSAARAHLRFAYRVSKAKKLTERRLLAKTACSSAARFRWKCWTGSSKTRLAQAHLPVLAQWGGTTTIGLALTKMSEGKDCVSNPRVRARRQMVGNPPDQRRSHLLQKALSQPTSSSCWEKQTRNDFCWRPSLSEEPVRPQLRRLRRPRKPSARQCLRCAPPGCAFQGF